MHINLFIKAVTRTKVELLTQNTFSVFFAFYSGQRPLVAGNSFFISSSTSGFVNVVANRIGISAFDAWQRHVHELLLLELLLELLPNRLRERLASQRTGFQLSAISYQISAISIQIYDYALKSRIQNIHKLLLFYRSIYTYIHMYKQMNICIFFIHV